MSPGNLEPISTQATYTNLFFFTDGLLYGKIRFVARDLISIFCRNTGFDKRNKLAGDDVRVASEIN